MIFLALYVMKGTSFLKQTQTQTSQKVSLWDLCLHACGPSFINHTKIQQAASAFPPLLRWINIEFCFVQLESDLLEPAGLSGCYPPSKSLQTDLTSWYKVTVWLNHVTPLCFSVGEDWRWRTDARGNAKKRGFSKGEGAQKRTVVYVVMCNMTWHREIPLEKHLAVLYFLSLHVSSDLIFIDRLSSDTEIKHRTFWWTKKRAMIISRTPVQPQTFQACSLRWSMGACWLGAGCCSLPGSVPVDI